MSRFLLLANPRTGSTYLANLLRSHPDVGLAGELLNSEHEIPDNCLEYLESRLSQMHQNFVGFKVFPEQIFERKLRFHDIVRQIGVNVVIVLWRKSVIEQLSSLKIAMKTGIWFSGIENQNENHVKEKIEISGEELEEYYKTLTTEWNEIGNQWPTDVLPIFVCYEDILSDPMKQLKTIFARMSCDIEKYSYASSGPVKKPIDPSKRIINWIEIEPELRNLEINVGQILNEIINMSLKVQFEALSLVPDREPSMPPNGWIYNVCAPFMPDKAKQNVMNALMSGSVSSAGFWPKQMSKKLKHVFGVPVAQPCSNGFTSLLLSMQAIGITKGDEIIMPAMTMIAVPNAVRFVGGVPVFADCAEGNYNPGLKEILSVATDKTKAIVLTHTYGVPAVDLELTVNECKKRGWLLIEDISECVGVTVNTISGEEKLLGTFGDFACASLYANKIIHAGDGGFVLAKDARLVARFQALVNHGFTPTYHFLHFESAVNAKINGLGAALACGCLDKMSVVLDHRKKLSQWYRNSLKDLPIKLMPECGAHDTPWVFGVECESKNIRTRLRAHLAEYGIETRDFFFPLHFQPAFKDISVNNSKENRPKAEKLGSSGFYLPTYFDLTEGDVKFIASVIIEFFSGKQCENKKMIKPNKKNIESISIKSGTFRIQALSFTKNGLLLQKKSRGHPFIEAVALSLRAENCLIHERWDECHDFVDSVKLCIKEATEMKADPQVIEKYFNVFTEYFSSQSSFEPTQHRQWINEDLSGPEYAITRNVSTTSDYETLQLLVWLIKRFKPRSMIELGSWMGHSTLLMAIAAQTYHKTHYRARIYACDVFRWQHWMGRYVIQSNIMANGQSFLPRFQYNTKSMAQFIEPIIMDYNRGFPGSMKQIRPSFVFIDFSQDSDEIEEKWQQIEPNLTPNQSIILFNGLSVTSIPFFTKHSHHLKALAKPHTIAKAFLYVSNDSIPKSINQTKPLRKFNFQTPPEWTHHHKNAFNASIDKLKDELHDEKSETLFIASVEEMLCDNPELLRNNRWVGIIHSVADFPEQFYTPDLNRLCSKRYEKYMKTCKGLFTLTGIQAEFLNQNLLTDCKIPIQPLIYPSIEPDIAEPSHVIDLLKSDNCVDLILIGGFARDYNLFYSSKVPKYFKKVLLIGENSMKNQIKYASNDVQFLDRLNGDEYEKQLRKSIPFLCLKYDGAANTLIIECIVRNIPILTPKLGSCVEYIGENYPLLYDKNQTDFTELLTIDRIQDSIDYLKSMNKDRFKIDYFIKSINNGIVLQSIPSIDTNNTIEKILDPKPAFNEFDLTICICSYKRTHHLSKILDSLWNNQSYVGKIQIIVWNNNLSRKMTVSKICDQYIIGSSGIKSLELISSTRNYICSVRLSMPQLMRSQCLLICDDDINPGPEFIQFFMSSHQTYPEDVLCLRGHKFMPHVLNVENPTNVWNDYDYLRFVGDEAPDQLIHFVHADACLIPKTALQECASIPMPDSRFALVDDYWLSFVLNHKFNRKLRKLSTKDLGFSLLERTEDSDEIGLALYTRPEVKEAKIQLYIHHMLQGWPHWVQNLGTKTEIDEQKLMKTKYEFWDKAFVGYNISCDVSENDAKDLSKAGVKCVRIGAVGLGDKFDYEFKGFLTEPEDQIMILTNTLSLLNSYNIKAVLTLSRKLSNLKIWRFIAENLRFNETVVGYDLINEPFTQKEDTMHWTQLEEDDRFIPELMLNYIKIIENIREVDKITPIMVEPSFWAHIDALYKFPVESLLSSDPSIIVSFHFYEPMILTQRNKNQNRFSFPSEIPVYENSKYKEFMTLDESYIRNKFLTAKEWSEKLNVKLVLGEFGISREIIGAQQYLDCIMKICKEFRISAFVYSFRDQEWDSMDYELGDDINTGRIRKPLEQNSLMQTIAEAINDINLI